MTTKGLFIDGRWMAGGDIVDVHDKHSGAVLGRVVTARPDDLDAACDAAVTAGRTWAATPAWRRSEILSRAAALLHERRGEFARTLACEAGKVHALARAEVDRAGTTFALAAEEARRVHGETLPMDAVPGGEAYRGFYTRHPVGVVAAVTPFNFPLNLVAHKVAPALAAGCSVVLKPATLTPLVSVALMDVLVDAGLPAGVVNLVVGSGSTVGARLVAHPAVAKVSFTGSADTGRQILATAGIKKVTMELGNTSPVVVDEGVDAVAVARRCAFGAFTYQGQVCISVQRVYVHQSLYEPFLGALADAARALRPGHPLDEGVDQGPLVAEAEARRVVALVDQARAEGARVVTGGSRQGSHVQPTVLADATDGMDVVRHEVFGPVVSVMPVANFDEGLRRAADTPYGLQAGVFTRDIERALSAADSLDFGGVVINDVPTFRLDHMPYGGVRGSGLGREGVRFAVEEMTNLRMVVIRKG